MAWHNTKPGKSRWMAEIVAKVGIVLIVVSLVAVARLQEWMYCGTTNGSGERESWLSSS